MDDVNPRDIALELSATYMPSEIENLDLAAEAKKLRVTLDFMKEAATMALSFLKEDYW